MTVHIALLRGINVGGHAKIAMADLRALVLELGFEAPQTLLQSGNLVFRGEGPGDASLERRLEAATAERLGVAATYFLRSAADWARIVAGNPFPDAATADPSHLVVQFLRTPLAADAVAALQAAIRGPELVRAGERHAYIVYPDGIGRSRLTGPMIEAKLGPATGRNWNTILKLAALAGLRI